MGKNTADSKNTPRTNKAQKPQEPQMPKGRIILDGQDDPKTTLND